jgi:hypothetical protein
MVGARKRKSNQGSCPSLRESVGRRAVYILGPTVQFLLNHNTTRRSG